MEKHSNPINPVELGQVVSTCACFNLRKASRVITQHFDEILKPSGLLITQFTILVAVTMAKSGTINELAEVLRMDRTTLTRNLKPLERQGWLRSEPGQDQRTRLVSLTTDGEAALTKALPLWRQAQTSVEETLGQQRLSDLLAHLVEATALVR
ncbi:MAG: winged helix-turn-helix transcriptional regulator [Microcoleus sp. PH2017_39_LGB_O_B]|uniref:MarR family winged helix-turn-helix transcriptional regulator n=1 Tax=Microcoleus sp. PH2017_09_SFU_O_A TaxID=2798820 RepID=UPI001DB21B37|nr:MarR family winged helix-turn-helix transcriptional regulator [Microcoleus sp. PH2017_09_SFU_O_A]MCC3584580.1 winged helix-turn-helix transcriptional regulator [Microcoleus sp. PH2017_30_WIL_O_A]MCC3630075.1 winged helix-turn-helix transcriptional regulator [Microcoleus sp. PH2017_39_LGB_O_B]MCC3644367.1 winged helix-turn-helix transcriptional regulator [Microcoleus sp. PH2017_33_LGB_O_A]TAE64858.1 MAG: MarR family transcriptional regulator [Oscillatoriales cyanobacterium]MCC3450503.1 winge